MLEAILTVLVGLVFILFSGLVIYGITQSKRFAKNKPKDSVHGYVGDPRITHLDEDWEEAFWQDMLSWRRRNG
jgi:hypothetical protein